MTLYLIEYINITHMQIHNRHKHALLALFSAVAALFTAGCAHDNDPDPGKHVEAEITFGANVSSRAPESNLATLRESGFGVFALLTWDKNFSDLPTASKYMYNQKVEWLNTDDNRAGWIYEPVLFWPGGQKISFFAYAPYSAGGNSSAIRGFSDPDSPGSPKLKFSNRQNAESQVDLLYARAIDCVYSPSVLLDFQHALSRISINLTETKVDANTTMKFNKLILSSSDIATDGVLDLMTGSWEDVSGQTEIVYTSCDDLKKNLMIIPPSNEAEIQISADYTVTTVDPKLESGCFVDNRLISTPLSIKLEAGKAYNFNVSVGLRSVSIDAQLTSWPDEDHKWENDHDKIE